VSVVAGNNFSDGVQGLCMERSENCDRLFRRDIVKETVKIYYFTRVLFGRLISSSNFFENKRFQSSRSRMFPSPNENYYHRAFLRARKFEED